MPHLNIWLEPLSECRINANMALGTLQVKRRVAAFDVLLTAYELIMAPADGQRLSQLTWNYIM